MLYVIIFKITFFKHTQKNDTQFKRKPKILFLRVQNRV